MNAPDAPATHDLSLPGLDPEGSAYILFTSGSTGAPKPVLTSRRALGVVTSSLIELFDVTPDDRVLQFASLNWDTCFEEIFPTLTSGGTLIFECEAYRGSLSRLLRAIQTHEITMLDLPTAYWHELVRHLLEEDITLPESVRLMVIGGEAASAAKLAEWHERVADSVRLVNTYGCTETTLITHAVDLHGPQAPGPGSWWGNGKPPIGRALPHVLEDIDERGELLIAGPCLATGYLGMPQATASRFTRRGGDWDGVRWFHTGDRVTNLGDGLLVHQGRLDHEIKVRGIRVDPAEVEAHLLEHPEVQAAAVVGVTAADRTAMTAYVVPRREREDLDAEIRADLGSRVPSHLVPHKIMFVPELAHTATGKIDRLASHSKYQLPAV